VFSVKYEKNFYIKNILIGLELNADKTRYMFMSRDQHVGKNHYINIGNKYSKRVQQLKYIGTNLKIKIILYIVYTIAYCFVLTSPWGWRFVAETCRRFDVFV
jgi:hypothetical protein